MKRTTRISALLLAVAILIVSLSGCASKPYVMEIDGMKIRRGIYAYYYGFSYANYYNIYGDSGVAYYATTNVHQHVALYRLFDEFGLELSESDQELIEKSRTAKIESLGGQGGYAAYLKTLGLTDKLYREILAIGPMYSRLKEYLYSEGGPEYMSLEEVKEEFASVYAHEVHIYISTADVETTADQEALYAKAEEALARARAGENFSDLIREYGDDVYMVENPEDGYYLMPGDSGSDVIDEALFALEVGEISDIITVTNGYFIYKRMPIEDEYIESVFADGQMYDSIIDEQLTYYIMDAMTDYETVYLPAFYEVDFSTAVNAFAMGVSLDPTVGTTTDATTDSTTEE